MASSLVPRIIVLALGAGVLGFPDALRVLLDDIAGRRRSPLTDIAICVLAMAVVTAQVLGAMLLARFVRKAPGAPPPRTDRFAQMTLVVSLGVAFLVSACLVVDAGGLGLLNRVVADIARKMKSPVIAVLATGAAALSCARPLLRVFREEDQSHGTGTGRFASMEQVAASFTGAAAFLLAVSGGGLYMQRGSLVGTVLLLLLLLARFAFTRRARNADAGGAGGRAAPAPASAAGTRRVGGKLTGLAPYLAVVSFVALLCYLVLTTYAPLESGPDGANSKYP